MAKALRRRGYHHGNLREALVAAARRLIVERGPAGFTLVEAARRAGVSAAAPYRHFKDRDALLAEVARRGFDAFARRLTGAWQEGGQSPEAAFLRMGEAYLAFAREEPGYYSAMFAVAPRAGRRPRKNASFAALESAIAQVAGGKQRDARSLAYQVWALSHGLATLAAAGQLPAAATLRPGALLRQGVGALIEAGVGGGRRGRTPERGARPRRRGAAAPRRGGLSQPRRPR
jgi:AcrR family transcriptional regulator